MFNYFVEKKENELFFLNNNNLFHIKNVVKLKVGQEIICTFKEEQFLSTILEINDNKVTAKIIKKLEEKASNVEINLLVGLIREQKWDYILQKATELNVSTIVPIEFKRNVVKIEAKKQEVKLKRWESICQSASQQSKRSTIPKIEPIVKNLNDLLKFKTDLNLVCWEEELKTGLKESLKNNKFKSISIIIGPEGGIDKSEIDILKEIGFNSITLGKNILRAETVPLYVLSCINYEKE